MLRKPYPIIIDDFGYTWTWNGRRIFCVEAEEEMKAAGESTADNGYVARTWDEALEALQDGGYIDTNDEEE